MVLPVERGDSVPTGAEMPFHLGMRRFYITFPNSDREEIVWVRHAIRSRPGDFTATLQQPRQ